MLNFDAGTSNAFIRLDQAERERDERVVPEDHFPRRWNRLVDFQRFLPLLNQEPLETRSSSGIGVE